MGQMIKDMAVIGFSMHASPLEPAWPSTHRALLPVAGKPVIVHLVEQLAAAGIKQIRIAGNIQQVAVKSRLGNGEEWGLAIRYSDLHGMDLCLQTLMEKEHCLYLLGDQLINLRAALESPVMKTAPDNFQQSDSVPAYWELTDTGYRCRELSMCGFGDEGRLQTIVDFHKANLKLATGMIPEMTMPGRAIREGVHVGWDSHIDASAGISAGVTIGNECHIGAGVMLGSGCVIGDGVVIRSGACLENVYVLPNCFVGSIVKMRDAIITPRVIFDLNGNYWLIDDADIISRVRSNREAITGLPGEAFSEIEKGNFNPAYSEYLLNKIKRIKVRKW